MDVKQMRLALGLPSDLVPLRLFAEAIHMEAPRLVELSAQGRFCKVHYPDRGRYSVGLEEAGEWVASKWIKPQKPTGSAGSYRIPSAERQARKEARNAG